MLTTILKVQSTSNFSCHSITEEIEGFLETTQQLEGVVCAFSQHSTVAMIINEMEERLILDLGKWLEEMAPTAQGYKHDDLELRKNIPEDEPKNAHSHLRALLLGNQVSVPFKDGKLQLGKYQDIIMVELDGPRERNIVCSIQ